MALVLTRKPGASIHLGHGIRIINRGHETANLAIVAPMTVPVWRSEIYQELLMSEDGLYSNASMPELECALSELDHCIQSLLITAPQYSWHYTITHLNEHTKITLWRSDAIWLTAEGQTTSTAAFKLLQDLRELLNDIAA